MKKKEQAKLLASVIYQAAAGKQGEELERIVSKFCDYLKSKGLMRMIDPILEELELIYFKDRGVMALRIISKNKLADSELDKIVSLVKSKTGKQIVVRQVRDEKVIGGAMVRYEDKILDFSLKSQIRNLARELSR
jgi:F-type H+-transporting ATPase subunit delta